MLEQCDFMELTEEVLLQCKGFTCKDEDITEFFTHDYADYAYHISCLGNHIALLSQIRLKSSVLSLLPIQA